jgi:uncharacterized repeat protein (TIGR03803 family)
LLSFDGTNGAMPYAGMIVAKDGNLYGTTCRGGIFNKGAIYKLTTNGILTAIFSFDGTNGWSPECELVQGQNGKIYGVCFIAGIFSIATDGTGFTSLHKFLNEQTPTQGLTLGADDNLYGYMPYGGSGNSGAIFKITPDGQFHIVVSCDNQTGIFCDGLTLGRDGNLYGTMAFGGKYYTGNFFRLSTNGMFTMLASFNETNNPRVFRNNLVQGLDGDFYGTTEFGGTHDSKIEDGDGYSSGDGTFFKVSTNGSAITLAYFYGQNGAHPRGKLTQTSDGNFYGVTVNGIDSQGTIFRATTNGIISTIFPFGGPYYEYAMTNGGWPCGLVRLSNGDFYGVTIYGGKAAHLAGYASGTVF